ncbi:asparagine synthetase B, partial [Microbacteriaceae bacterium K1510]|nr:asparagine synthetase B [Microbacteriaceae bacterium K1510]
SMVAALSHRGPDAYGVFRDAGVALGHARLSIVDLAGGAQPMCNEDGTIWTTFNGEIFNYTELRAELEAKGHTFRTRCDTEVIV